MHKVMKILGAILLVLGLAAASGYWWLSRPVELKEFEESVPLETRQRNSDVLTMLAVVGIEDALVDIDAERAYIAYGLPATGQHTPDEIQKYVLGVAAVMAPESPLGMIVQFIDGKPALGWEGDLDALRAVMDGNDPTAEERYLATVSKYTA